MPARTIAILFHENETLDSIQGYRASQLADYWREDGHEVFYLFGTSQFIPADLVFVHVNLSVVPEPYFEFARRYPIVVNGEVRDIRKSSFSQNIVRCGDSWEGEVIVKSDLNYGGAPEEQLAVAPSRQRSFSYRLWRRYRRMRSLWFRDARGYSIYDHLSRVPSRFFEMPGIIVEKFLPEMDGELFCTRNSHFLGDRSYTLRWKDNQPCVDGYTWKDVESVEPHPEIVAARERMKIDYGKLDYVVVDGKAILLDLNKTTGRTIAGRVAVNDQEIAALRRSFADGIYFYFR